MQGIGQRTDEFEYLYRENDFDLMNVLQIFIKIDIFTFRKIEFK